MRCLDDDMVLGLVEGRLAPPVLATVDEHLDTCASCRDVVTQVARSLAPARTLERGETVGRYVIGELVGEGAMGRVYSAWQPELDRRVALKLLATSDASARDRVIREAKAMAKLDHPNVVGVHEVGTADEAVYVAMELVEGDTLRAYARTSHPWRETAALLADIARGLAAVHAAGVVHRDVKPENIVIGRDRRARIADFGLARAGASSPLASSLAAGSIETNASRRDEPLVVEPAAGETATDDDAARGTREVARTHEGAGGIHKIAHDTGEVAGGTREVARGTREDAHGTREDAHGTREVARGTGEVARGTREVPAGTVLAGTPAYMAPEVAAGESATPASDQFSFGVTAYEVLAGSRPFRASTFAQLREAYRTSTVAPLREVPSWLDAAIRRCLSIDPAARFPSLLEVAELIARGLQPRQGARALLGGVAVATLVASSITYVALREPAAGPSCASGASEIATTWNARTRLQLAHLGEPALRALDAWTSAWAAEKDATCAAAAHATPAMTIARDRCLDRRRDEAAALIAALSASTPPTTALPAGSSPASTSPAASAVGASPASTSPAASAVGASPASTSLAASAVGASPASTSQPTRAYSLIDTLASLPAPDECASAARDPADPIPLDTTRATIVLEVQRQLASLRATLALGDARPILDAAARLVETARSSQHAPTLAEAELLHADALRAASQLDAAVVAVRAAAADAERGHADQLAARIWLARVAIAGDRRDLDSADDLLAIASGAVDRAGAPPRLVAMLRKHQGLVAYNRGDLATARAMLTEAHAKLVALATTTDVGIAVERIAVESALGSVERAAGNLDAAEQWHQRAYDADRALRGEVHPDIARDLHNLAGVARLRGDLALAFERYASALAIEIATRGEDSVEAGLTRNSLGLVALARAHAAMAPETPGARPSIAATRAEVRAQLAEARSQFGRARDIFAAASHGDRAFAEHNLGLVDAAAGDHRSAIAHFEVARRLYEQTIGGSADAAKRLVEDRAASERALGGAAPAVSQPARPAASAGISQPARSPASAMPAPASPAAVGAAAVGAAEGGDVEPVPVTTTVEPFPPVPDPPPPPPRRKRDVGVYGSTQSW